MLPTTPGAIRILRPGGVSRERLVAVLGEGAVIDAGAEAGGKGLQSPGMLSRHYSPRKPLALRGSPAGAALGPRRLGVLAFRSAEWATGLSPVRTEILSPAGDLEKAAANLFAALHRLDGDEAVEAILAEAAPEEGLGRAINDRLRRAGAVGERPEISG